MGLRSMFARAQKFMDSTAVSASILTSESLDIIKGIGSVVVTTLISTVMSFRGWGKSKPNLVYALTLVTLITLAIVDGTFVMWGMVLGFILISLLIGGITLFKMSQYLIDKCWPLFLISLGLFILSLAVYIV